MRKRVSLVLSTIFHSDGPLLSEKESNRHRQQIETKAKRRRLSSSYFESTPRNHVQKVQESWISFVIEQQYSLGTSPIIHRSLFDFLAPIQTLAECLKITKNFSWIHFWFSYGEYWLPFNVPPSFKLQWFWIQFLESSSRVYSILSLSFLTLHWHSLEPRMHRKNASENALYQKMYYSIYILYIAAKKRKAKRRVICWRGR